MAARTYVVDLAGGTTTTTVQMTGRQTLKNLGISWINAAAGKIEVSTVSASQIGTTQPTPDVIYRVSVGATGQSNIQVSINEPVEPFQNIYIHQTGAGNLATLVLS